MMVLNLKSAALFVVSVLIALAGVPFFGDRTFYWAGEIVGNPTKIVIGFAFIVFGLLIAYSSGALKTASTA